MRHEHYRTFRIMVTLALVLAMASASLMSAVIAQAYDTITPEEAYNELNSGSDVFLLDVREYDEYVDGHIEGAVLIPVGQLDANQDLLPADKDMTIIVYCRTGNRAATASDALVGYGYTDVSSIDGGIMAWPYDVETGDPNAAGSDDKNTTLSADSLIIIAVVLIVVVAGIALGMGVMKKKKDRELEKLREERKSKKGRRR